METTSTSSRINVVFYAESEDQARRLASKVLNQSEGDVYTEQFEGVTFSGYIRWPSSMPTASPAGITDILIVELSSANSEHFEAAQLYIDGRRGIPFKFLSSSADLSAEAKNSDAEFVGELSGDVKEKVLRSALNLEKTLRDTFTKIDCNNNGFIDSKEIMQASEELGHILSSEDAKEIAASLSANGQISFAKFKQWWVMGRTDFNCFRKLVGIEMVVNNFVKQSSNVFNSYLEQLQKEGQDSSAQQTGLLGTCNISPYQDFDFGSALNLHLTVGNDFVGIANSLPSYLRETPASFGVEIRLKNEADGTGVIETLKGIKDMVMGSIPNVAEIFEAGVAVNFRQVGTSVFVDVSYGGMLGDQISGILSMFNFAALNFTGGHDVHFTTKFTPVDILTATLEQLVENVLNAKFEAKGEYSHLKTAFNFIINTLTTLNHGSLPDKFKYAAYFLRSFAAIRKVDFDFKYDPAIAYEVFREFINNQYEESDRFEKKCKEWTEEKQVEANGMLTAVTQQAGMFLDPFKPALLAIDLDNISVYGLCPLLRLYAKVSLMIRGASGLVAAKLA